jgi:uncharacterized protein (TIGR02271 family)
MVANTNAKSLDWDDVIKKEARGKNGEDLGEVQEIGPNYVLTQKGIINKEKFYLPKSLVEGYDGHALYFSITEDEAKSEFIRDSPPLMTEYEKYEQRRSGTGTSKTEISQTPGIAARVPVIEERLNVNKRQSQEEVVVTKEPVTETKTVEVPVTREEISVERKPVDKSSAAEGGPVQSKTEVRIPVNREEIEVTKEPYVKEEVQVQKKPITETKTVSEQTTSEKVDIKGPRDTETD